MNIARIDQYPSNDFVIEGNHARMSQRKVADIIGVSHTSVQRWVGNLDDNTLAETLKVKGFDGGNLNDIVGYYVTSTQVSQDVKDNCVKLLIESSKVGFQVLIDKMAGLESTIESNEMKLFNDYCQVTDMIFRNTHIKPELIAGVKLSQAEKLLPHLADTLKANRQLLVESTASDVKLMTPTQLGERLSISNQKVNKRLIDAGLQVKNENKQSRKEPSYIPTDKGHEFCSFTLSTGQKGDVTSYQQLLWYESVLSVIG
jgi:predicted transcriptional regulator/biotin operon repressor